jgi:cation/acetate symporter
MPKDAERARAVDPALADSHERAKPLGGLPPHSRPLPGDPQGTPEEQGV